MARNGTEADTVYAVVYGSVITLGLPLNALSLWILLRHHSRKSANAVFMIHLVISDLLLIISLPMKVYFYATNKWPLGDMACIWLTMLFRNNIRSSAVFITFISIDRLLAVVYPLKSRQLRSLSNASKGAALVWLIVVIVNIPESVYFSKYLKNKTSNVSTCFDDKNDFFPPIAYFQLVLLFTLLFINIVSTVLVSLTLNRHLNITTRINNRVNVMLIFAMNLLMFCIFFLPVSLTVFFDNRRAALNCLASVNCCLDPLLYYFSFDGFWKKKEDTDRSTE
ncbi:lysophosphatidic acid receptor 6-like [Oreochromis aureus]|uniref:G-protein coupled receptors family 1 profile domain-containing protein n=1 Tax=Oreochromis aureus TaxID=47969 RepID=A0A668U2G5_OREAU|nr:lysophosphatidic acid receptor 6-like [Oreochromis aureus]